MNRPSTEDLLAKVPLFRDLSKRHLRQVAGLATTIDGQAGKVLIREGQAGLEFIVILEGEVEVLRGDEVISTRGPGDFVGEIALVEDVPRTASIVAKTPVVIDVIGRREFATLLANEPEIADKVKSTAEQRRHELEATERG